jgi:hypothetical protein
MAMVGIIEILFSFIVLTSQQSEEATDLDNQIMSDRGASYGRGKEKAFYFGTLSLVAPFRGGRTANAAGMYGIETFGERKHFTLWAFIQFAFSVYER